MVELPCAGVVARAHKLGDVKVRFHILGAMFDGVLEGSFCTNGVLLFEMVEPEVVVSQTELGFEKDGHLEGFCGAIILTEIV